MMKTVRNCALLTFVFAVCTITTLADNPGQHPGYLHALSDMRDARAHLDRLTPSDHLDNEEEHAIKEIDAAIGEIKKAAIDDGKDLKDHPPVDAHLDKKGRYHKALELLDRAHHDISEKEDDQFAHGLRHRALDHIDEAHKIVDHLIVQASNN
jgi:tetratricopeptide (TPR) repeat protein